jgi:hypothetical protein
VMPAIPPTAGGEARFSVRGEHRRDQQPAE